MSYFGNKSILISVEYQTQWIPKNQTIKTNQNIKVKIKLQVMRTSLLLLLFTKNNVWVVIEETYTRLFPPQHVHTYKGQWASQGKRAQEEVWRAGSIDPVT